MPPRGYQNILVINLMHLGDLMLVTPVLRTLRHNYPAARITLLADRILADIVQENQNIDECLLIDKKGRDRSFLGILRFAHRLRKHKYDLVVNLHRNERASALAAFSGGKKIIGYAKPGFSLLFDHVSPDQHMVMHEVHSHYAALRAAGIIGEVDDAGLEMWLPPAAEAEAARLWAAHFAPTDKVIALNIGASWRTKRWEDAYFAEIADTYLARGYHVAVMGGPTDVEMVAACRAQMREQEHPHLHIFTGQVSLGVLAGLHDGLGSHAHRRCDECPRALHVRRVTDSGLLPLRREEHFRPRARSVPSLPPARMSAYGGRVYEVHEADTARADFAICGSDAQGVWGAACVRAASVDGVRDARGGAGEWALCSCAKGRGGTFCPPRPAGRHQGARI